MTQGNRVLNCYLDHACRGRRKWLPLCQLNENLKATTDHHFKAISNGTCFNKKPQGFKTEKGHVISNIIQGQSCLFL